MLIRTTILIVLAFLGRIPLAFGQTATDTISPRVLIMPVKSDSQLRDMRFSDTSSYAVIYLYRRYTGTFPKTSIGLYVEDEKICSMENKGHYIFAVYRSRTLKLTGMFSHDTCHITVSIEPGRSYYLRCELETGIFGEKHRLRNYKILLDPMPAEKGKKQFDRTLKPTTFWS
ncbi:MAG TPA: hypothetical protein VGS79_01520 [Puia sp.]|nr:hypothetical protein [Puia sp.]